jgi:NAD(P)-dependent dehydrogenase (short-subunit alcohol dehydrogenase family)
MSIEWAKYGIRVNAVAPGYVKTEMVNNLIRQRMFTEEEICKRIPIGRMASPKEIADVCIFLASEKASYITGAVIFVDGGWTAYGYI